MQNQGCSLNISTPATMGQPIASGPSNSDGKCAKTCASMFTACVLSNDYFTCRGLVDDPGNTGGLKQAGCAVGCKNTDSMAEAQMEALTGGGQNRRNLGLVNLDDQQNQICPWDSVDDRLRVVDEVCCASPNECNGTAPATCSPLCAVAFHMFYGDCGSQLKLIRPTVQLMLMQFDQTCTSTRTVDTGAFLYALKHAHCTTCSDDKKNGDETSVDCGGSCGNKCTVKDTSGYVTGPRAANDGQSCLMANGKYSTIHKSTWYGSYADAVAKCNASPDCWGLHDWGGDAQNWRACKQVAFQTKGPASTKVKPGMLANSDFEADTKIPGYKYMNPTS